MPMLFYPSVSAYITSVNNGIFLYDVCHLRPETPWKGNPFVVISCLPRKLLKLISWGACWEVKGDKVFGLQIPVQSTFVLAPNCLRPSVTFLTCCSPGKLLSPSLDSPFLLKRIRTRAASLFLFHSCGSQNAFSTASHNSCRTGNKYNYRLTCVCVCVYTHV